MLSYDEFKERMLRTADVFTPVRYQDRKPILITEEIDLVEKDYLTFEADTPNVEAPCVCLREAYRIYQERENICDSYLYAMETLLYEELVIDDLELEKDYDFCKTRVLLKLIGPEQEKDMPANLVTRPFLDLKIMYQIYFKVAGNQIQPIVVTNRMLNTWGIDEEELYRTAYANTMYRASFICTNMLDVLRRTAIRNEWQYSVFEQVYESAKEKPACFAIWDKNHVCSSVILLATHLLKEMSKRMGGDLYLFVSKEGMDCADATQMTKEQAFEYLHSVLLLFDENDAVPLSTSLYRYDAKTESVVIVERMA